MLRQAQGDVYSLLETIADIAYYAEQKRYYSGDSRADIADFIWWAKEFEQLHRFTDWGREDYMLAVEEYAEEKTTDVWQVEAA